MIRFLLRIVRRVILIALSTILGAAAITEANISLGVPLWACNWLAILLGVGLLYFFVWRRKGFWL